MIAHLKRECVFADRVTEIASIPALVQASMISKTPTERIAFAKERLSRPNAWRPRTRKTLMSHVAAIFLKTLSESDLKSVVDGLLKDGCVRENGKRIEYADEAT